MTRPASHRRAGHQGRAGCRHPGPLAARGAAVCGRGMAQFTSVSGDHRFDTSRCGSLLAIVYVTHAAKKLRDRLGVPAGAGVIGPSDTVLGSWYATAVFWKPQVALFVNEATLLPVLMSLAPTATLTDRFPAPCRSCWPPTACPTRSQDVRLVHKTPSWGSGCGVVTVGDSQAIWVLSDVRYKRGAGPPEDRPPGAWPGRLRRAVELRDEFAGSAGSGAVRTITPHRGSGDRDE